MYVHQAIEYLIDLRPLAGSLATLSLPSSSSSASASAMPTMPTRQSRFVTIAFTRERLSDATCAGHRATYAPLDALIAGARQDGVSVSSDTGTIGTRLGCGTDEAVALVEREFREGRPATLVQFCRKYKLIREDDKLGKKEGVEGVRPPHQRCLSIHYIWYIVTHTPPPCLTYQLSTSLRR